MHCKGRVRFISRAMFMSHARARRRRDQRPSGRAVSVVHIDRLRRHAVLLHALQPGVRTRCGDRQGTAGCSIRIDITRPETRPAARAVSLWMSAGMQEKYGGYPGDAGREG